MTVTIDITDQAIFTALVSYLAPLLPVGTPIVQSQDNQVPMPAGGFVLMNNTSMTRIATNIDTYNSTTQTQATLTQTEYCIQLDFVGPDSQSWAMIAAAMFRDEYATSRFPANIQPLFADDPMQIPLIAAENQYEERWKLTATIQYNPTIGTTQQSATAVKIGLAPVDQTFKP